MKATTMRSLRQWHRYLGLFFAPLIILFAVSGGLQTFRLQEAKGYGGTPPDWIVWFASIHKDQAIPHDAPEAPKAAAAAPSPAAAMPAKKAPAKSARSFPLQLFVVAMALALILSSVLGITIALSNRATRTASIVLLAAGAILPIVFLKL